MLCAAIQPSNCSQRSYFSGSGRATVDNDWRAGERRRRETQLQVNLGDAGTISVGPPRDGDAALDMVPDGADAECFVELRACSSCWISLTAILNRSDESEVASSEDGRHLMTINDDSKNEAVTNCRLWLVDFVSVYGIVGLNVLLDRLLVISETLLRVK